MATFVYRALQTENTKAGYIRDGGPTNYCIWPYMTDGNHFLIPVSVESGDRVWVTNYVDVYGAPEGWLVTPHPYFSDYTAYLDAKHFKAIKDLSADDLALYNKNNK